MTRNSLRKLRTGVLVSLAGAAVLSTAQVAKAEETTTSVTEPAVTTTAEVPTEVVEAQISALESEIATLVPAVATPVTDNGVYASEATATETVSTVEANLATAEATLATATTELETLQSTPETAIPNGEQPYVTAVDEAQKAYDAKVAELETATETVTTTISPDDVALSDFRSGNTSVTRLEPVYDGERTVTLPLDENFQVDTNLVEDLIVKNIQDVRTANGLTGNGVRTVEANKIAEYRLKELQSAGVMSHSTELPVGGMKDVGIVTTSDGTPYVFISEALMHKPTGGGSFRSNEQFAHEVVQGWLTDYYNVSGNNIGHSDNILSRRYVEYGVATDGEFVVITFSNPDYDLGGAKNTLSSFQNANWRSVEGQSGYRDLTRDEVIGKTPVVIENGTMRSGSEPLLVVPAVLKEYAEEASLSYSEKNRSIIANNYNGSPTQAQYLYFKDTDELKLVKYLPKTTFVYTQERPISQSDKDAELYNYIVALNKAKTDLTNYRLMNPTNPNAVSNANAIREAEARVASAQGKVNNLKAQLTSAKTALGTAKSNVSAYESRLAEYSAKSARLAQARRELEALKARLASAGNGVSTQPVVVTEPIVPVVTQPTVVAEPVTPEVTTPAVVTEPVTPAVTPPAVVTEPVTPEVTPPAVVTEPVTPAVTPPAVVTEPVTPAVTTPAVVTESVTPVVEPSETVTAPAPAGAEATADKTATTKPETTETEAGKALANGGAAGNQATVKPTEEAQASSPVAPTKVDLATPLTAPAPAATPVETKQVSEPEGGATALAASSSVATPTYSRVAARQALPATGSRASYASLLAGLSSLSLAGLVWKRKRG